MKSIAGILALSAAASSEMIFSATPPKGFNTFDNYKPYTLNTERVLELAKTFKDQYGHMGYDTFTLDGGWSGGFNEYGAPIANATRYPNMTALSDGLHQMGMKLGLWNIRGIHSSLIGKNLPVKGTNYTLEDLVDQAPTNGARNGSCHWSSTWLGVNASHPGAMAYYQERVDVLNSYGVDFIKADCMMCSDDGCYYGEMDLYSQAVRNVDRKILLSYSPGGQNHPMPVGHWVAENQMAGMYRITTDFHGAWGGAGGVQQGLFVAGNFTASGLDGNNQTYPDLDMIPLDSKYWDRDTEHADRGQTIATLWMVARSPLFEAGELPSDNKTLSYMVNADAMEYHDFGTPSVVKYTGNCTCFGKGDGHCGFPSPYVGESCVAVWKSTLTSSKDVAVALFNMGENNVTASATAQELGLSNDFSAKNIWTSEVTKHTGSISAPLRPHESAFFRIPQL